MTAKPLQIAFFEIQRNGAWISLHELLKPEFSHKSHKVISTYPVKMRSTGRSLLNEGIRCSNCKERKEMINEISREKVR